MSTLKLRSIGNSVGVVLPRELLAKLGVGEGDTLFAIDVPDGVRLTKSDPDFEARMVTAGAIMKGRHAALRELAK